MRLLRSRGFTVLEILVVVTLIFIITGIVVVAMGTFRDTQARDAEVEQVLALLGEARTDTIASKDASSYGVHFTSSSITLFKGTTYTAGDANNEEADIDSALSLVNISFAGGGSDVVFNRLTGTTDDYGTLVIRVGSSSDHDATISIAQTGIATLM